MHIQLTIVLQIFHFVDKIMRSKQFYAVKEWLSTDDNQICKFQSELSFAPSNFSKLKEFVPLHHFRMVWTAFCFQLELSCKLKLWILDCSKMTVKLKCSAFVPFALVIVLRVSISDAFDAEFGRIIAYDNFDHFKVSAWWIDVDVDWITKFTIL